MRDIWWVLRYSVSPWMVVLVPAEKASPFSKQKLFQWGQVTAIPMMKVVQSYQLNVPQSFIKICIIKKRKLQKFALLIALEINSSTVRMCVCAHASLFASFFEGKIFEDENAITWIIQKKIGSPKKPILFFKKDALLKYRTIPCSPPPACVPKVLSSLALSEIAV